MKPLSRFQTILIIAFIIFPFVSQAAQKNKERRLALVIGNDAYKSAPLHPLAPKAVEFKLVWNRYMS